MRLGRIGATAERSRPMAALFSLIVPAANASERDSGK